jgi:Family of unknown function (DUF6299)
MTPMSFGRGRRRRHDVLRHGLRCGTRRHERRRAEPDDRRCPPAPTVSLTIDPRGAAFKDGSALVSGTYTCSGQSMFSFIDGTLTQKVGRVKISGYVSVGDLVCDGATHTWSAYVYSDNGIFAGGKAASVSMAVACGAVSCGEGWVEQTIQLSRAKQK